MQFYNVYQSGKRLYIDEKENPDNKIIVNKYDNMQQTLKLISDGTLPPRLYWALRNPKLSNKYFILKLVNNEDLIVGTDISATPGLWDMLLIGTDEDYIIEGADIDQSRLTYVSDHFGRLFVRDNFLEELDFEEQCSPTFRVFYDEIMFRLDNIPDLGDIPDQLSDLENDTGFISGVTLKDDGEGNVSIIGTTFSGGETEEGGVGGNYTLPVANENQLGGVKPLNKTEDMMLPVGVDKDGRLFAKGKDVTVDSELDEESQNPVQNQAIAKEVIALKERNAELEESIEKLQIKSTTDKAPFHHITDSANYRVLDFGMEGITEQDTAPGNQLFDISKFKSDAQATNNGDGSIKLVDYAPKMNNKISECCPNIVVGQTICWRASNGNLLYFGGSTVGYGKSLVVTQEMLDRDYIGFYGINGTTTSDNPLTISDIMINEGTTALPNEPFTGNQPSPNPDYPQDIVNAGVLNEETGRYEIGCVVGNKNLFNYCNSIPSSLGVMDGNIFRTNAKVHSTYVTLTNVVFEENTQYVLTCDEHITFDVGTSGTNTNLQGLQISIDYTDGSWSGGYFRKGAEFTTIANKTVKSIKANNPFGVGVEYVNVQIYKLSDGDEYVIGHSQPFTLTSDRPLTKWDKLVKRDGVWGWSIWSELKYTNVTEGDLGGNGNSTDNYYRFYVYGIHAYKGAECVCNIATYSSSQSYNNECGFWWDNNFCMMVHRKYVGYTEEDTHKDILQKFRDNVLGKGITVYYKTQTEKEFIPLPEEEQTLLNNIETYYGVTNVYNEQGCPMWLTYVSDPELHWNQKLQQINNALLSLGANV